LNNNKLDIRKIRTSLGISQIEFAKRLGVTTRTVQNYEERMEAPLSIQKLIQHEFYSSVKKGLGTAIAVKL